MDLTLIAHLETVISSGMSGFQMRNFVIGDQQTDYGKVKQALREVTARLESVIVIDFDIESLDIDIAELEAKHLSDSATSLPGDLGLRRIKLDINKKLHERSRKLKQKQQLESEINLFYEELLNSLSSGFADVDNLLSELADPEKLERLETDYWVAKLSQAATSDMLNYGTLSKGTADAIANLGSKCRAAIIENSAGAVTEIKAVLQAQLQIALKRSDK